MLIIDDLLFWLPLKGIVSVTEQIKKVADREQKMKSKKYNQGLDKIRELRTKWREGAISQRDYERQAIEILKEISNKQ